MQGAERALGSLQAKASDGDCDGELRPFREICGKLGVPGSRLFGHCTLRRHPFLDSPPTIITLVRLHFSPPRRLPPETSIASKRLRLGKYPQAGFARPAMQSSPG